MHLSRPPEETVQNNLFMPAIFTKNCRFARSGIPSSNPSWWGEYPVTNLLFAVLPVNACYLASKGKNGLYQHPSLNHYS
jgi:hypothetical protein